MLTRPPDVTDAQVLDAVRRHWCAGVDAVEHLPVGWGAHHWRADANGRPVLFVTVDPPLARHTPESLDGAYATAAGLDLDFVWPPLATHDGTFTVALGARRLSVTGWLDGERPDTSTPDLPDMLARLHAVEPPAEAPVWVPLVDPWLTDRVRDLLQRDWAGPLGQAARDLLLAHLAQVTSWSREHAFLVGRAEPASYVVTHGEPGVHNQWRARDRTWLIDWETLLLAPRERDLVTLVQAGVGVDHDPAMVRLFDLEWRLDEIWSFATWLQGPHRGDADDRTALSALAHELTRPHHDES